MHGLMREDWGPTLWFSYLVLQREFKNLFATPARVGSQTLQPAASVGAVGGEVALLAVIEDIKGPLEARV